MSTASAAPERNIAAGARTGGLHVLLARGWHADPLRLDASTPQANPCFTSARYLRTIIMLCSRADPDPRGRTIPKRRPALASKPVRTRLGPELPAAVDRLYRVSQNACRHSLKPDASSQNAACSVFAINWTWS